jgi:2-dehydro-3-deoxyglucarate aldolase/4-hydroxy-2-oxoheptanedioate aldolase
VIAQIETAEGLADVESIAAVPGIDVLWIGQFDLTNFLGIPGDFAHPRFAAALDRVLAACERHRKAPAILAPDDASAETFAGRGFRMMAYGIDHLLLQQALSRGIAALRERLARRTDE